MAQLSISQSAVPFSRSTGGQKVLLSSEERELLSESKLASFLAAVQTDRIQVTQGRLYKPDVITLACAGITTSCNGINNTNPYLVTSIPTPGGVYNPLEPPLSFTIRQDEAVVLIGRTPPPVAYFSFRSFIFNRYFERESVRHKVFGSLGDPHNMLTLKTKGTAKGDPYDKAFVLIAASDKGTETRVRKALALAGYPDEIINTDVISPNLAKMSSKANGDYDEVKDDDFLLLERVALWGYGYEEAGAEYLANPPVTVLRLTPEPRTEKANYSPLPVEKLRPRGTGLTEMDLTPEVNALRDAIIAKNPGMKADELLPTTWLEESFVALQKELDVLGESRDTVYLRNEGTFTLADDEFVMIYGANHQRTGKATYANFAAYSVCKACPFGGENSLHVAGSALDYFPDATKQPDHVDSLYAWKMARKCGGDLRCTEIPYGDCTTGIDENGQMFIGFRAYVEPATKVGPAFSELIYYRVLRFTPTAPEITDVTITPDAARIEKGGVLQGTSVEIKFKVKNAIASDITWTATLKGDDGCGELTPSTKKVASGEVTSTTLTVPAKQNSILTLFLNATDAKGRRAKPLGVQLKFVPPPPI